MGIKLILTNRHTPGGDRKEVLPPSDSRRRYEVEHGYTNWDWICALTALRYIPGEDVPTINIKKVFSTCRDKFCSINGAPVGRILDESIRQERAMLAQTETKSKASLGGRNG
jgi:hypothetical protein